MPKTHNFVLLGARKSGKSALINRYMTRLYISEYTETLGQNTRERTYSHGNKIALTEIGSNPATSVDIEKAVSKADNIILTFNMIAPPEQTQKYLESQLSGITKTISGKPCLLVGTHLDMVKPTLMPSLIAFWEDFAKAHRIERFIPTSSKQHINVDYLFQYLVSPHVTPHLSFPINYERIWAREGSDIKRMMLLLQDYARGGSTLSLFVSGHSGRTHTTEVMAIIKSIEESVLTTPTDVLDALKRIPKLNPSGSLAKRIEFIEQKVCVTPMGQALKEPSVAMGLAST